MLPLESSESERGQAATAVGTASVGRPLVRLGKVASVEMSPFVARAQERVAARVDDEGRALLTQEAVRVAVGQAPVGVGPELVGG